MKQSDIISTVLIGVIGFIISYFCVSMFFHPDEEVVNYKTVDTISSEVAEPNESVFNTNAINPTVEAVICDQDGNGVVSNKEKENCLN